VRDKKSKSIPNIQNLEASRCFFFFPSHHTSPPPMLANALVGVTSSATPRRRRWTRDNTSSPAVARWVRASGASGGKTDGTDATKKKPLSKSPGSVQNDAISLLGGMQSNWTFGTYHSKRATHKVNELGDIIGEHECPENISEQPGWDDAGKLKFCVATVAQELNLSEPEVSEKLKQLFTLAPGMERRVGDVKIAHVVRMVASLPDVVQAFVHLRTILPNADLGKIVESRPSVLLEDLDAMSLRIAELREETPSLNWCAIFTDFPNLFEIKNLAGSVRELQTKFPGKDASAMIGRRPLLLLQMQSGEDMIQYDHGSLKQVKATIEGDRTHDGW
jgi:hypothetical protein